MNCAGTTDFIPFSDLDQATDEVWQRLYQVNVVGAFHCARAVREPMLASGGGQIINVSSVAAQLGQGSSIPYCCTKPRSTISRFLWRATLAPKIRVNGVAPRIYRGTLDAARSGGTLPQPGRGLREDVASRTGLHPEGIAEGIVSLVTGSPLVTGQTLTWMAG